MRELHQSPDDEEGDALDVGDRQRLHAAIARSEAQFQAGEGIPADEALAQLERLSKR